MSAAMSEDGNNVDVEVTLNEAKTEESRTKRLGDAREGLSPVSGGV